MSNEYTEDVKIESLEERRDGPRLEGRWEQDERTVSGYSIFEGLTCDDGLYTDSTFKASHGYSLRYKTTPVLHANGNGTATKS